MKGKQRAIRALAACLCMLLCASPALAYADVTEQSPYYQAAKDAAKYGLMQGIGDNLFDPDGVMSRAMFVAALGRALGVPAGDYTGESPFYDVPSDSWCAPYVTWAKEHSVASGVGDGRFLPDAPVNRQEAATLLFAAYKEAGQDPAGAWMIALDYSDAQEIDAWAYEGVAYCATQGIMMDAEGAFRPRETVTRGQAAVMLTAFAVQVLDGLYQDAVADAVSADSDEIMPLLTLTPGTELTTWDEEGRVLMLSWHRYPESYPEGQEVTLDYGEVWTFTDGEIRRWYQKNGGNITAPELRLEQLIGLPRDKGYTHVSAFWVDPDDLARPAYVTDVTSGSMSNYFIDADLDYLEWFEGNIQWSYTENAYPWTRLGYTYDWSLYGGEYGLTEFIIWPGSTVEVAFTKTTGEFLDWLAE